MNGNDDKLLNMLLELKVDIAEIRKTLEHHASDIDRIKADHEEMKKSLPVPETESHEETEKADENEHEQGTEPETSEHGDAESNAVEPPAENTKVSDAENRKEELEFRIGGVWLNRIAIILIIASVGYFLKYAFDSNWINPSGRILLGSVFGICFMLCGEIFRNRKYVSFSQGLTGGGIAILYFSIFAGYYFFRYDSIIPQNLAVALMMIVTAVSVGLAIRYDSKAVALLGLIGGFCTPLMFNTEAANYESIFLYLLVLNFGIMLISYYKKWNFLNYLSFGMTEIIMVANFASYFDNIKSMFIMTGIFFTLTYLMYLAIPVLYSIAKHRNVKAADNVIIIMNTLVYSGVCYAAINAVIPDYRGFFAIVMAVIYAALSIVIWLLNSTDTKAIVIFAGTALAFLTAAVPLQLYKYSYIDWVTVGWIIEAVILAFVGLKIKSSGIRKFAAAVILLAAARFAVFDLGEGLKITSGEKYIPFINQWSVEFLLISVGAFITALIYGKNISLLSEGEKNLRRVLFVIANTLLLVQLSYEIVNYFSSISGAGKEYSHVQAAVMGIVWSVYALALGLMGFARGSSRMRNAAVLLFGIMLYKYVFIDTGLSLKNDTGYIPGINLMMLEGVLAAVCLIIYAIYYGRRIEKLEEQEKKFFNILLMAGLITFGVSLSMENIRYFEFIDDGKNYRNEMQFGLSIIWALYSIILIIIGIIKKYKPIRIFAIALFGVAAFKAFVFDMSILSGVYRVLSLIIPGFILLIVSFLYQRYRHRILDEK